MNIGECMEYAQKLCDATTATERNSARAELRAAIAAAVSAERERWEMHLSATRRLAEANSKRGDDCGMLARTLLDTLKAMKA